jgi:hypothetical protein
MIQILASIPDREPAELGSLGQLVRVSPSQLRWRLGRFTELLNFSHGSAYSKAAICHASRVAIVASHYSPEVYQLDSWSPPRAALVLELPRQSDEAGLRRLYLVPSEEDLLIIYELGLVYMTRCRHVRWHQVHGHFEWAFAAVSEGAVHFEDQDDQVIKFRTADGHRLM